ncbi:hypothetical protein M2351_004230 [Azospirillum canadense]|nr:hypothetical protein [Azospirillum canadense]
MGPTAVELVAGIVDQMEWAVTGTGRPPVPTNAILETLRFFLREGVQWRELRASPDRASGSTLRRRLTEWSATAIVPRGVVSEGASVLFGGLRPPVYSAAMDSGSGV